MPRATRVEFQNVRELQDRLGGVPTDRIRLDPLPGQATVRDLLNWHERGGRRYELIDRTLVEKAMGAVESYIAMELGRLVGNHLAATDLGFVYGADALIRLIPGLVRGPDLCFVSWVTRPEHTVPRGSITDTVPDLAVEVLSPRNTRREMLRKRKEYFLAGVRLVWEIDPRTRTAIAYTAPDAKTAIPEDGVLDGGEVLPGFRLPLATLFAKLERPAGAKKPRKRK